MVMGYSDEKMPECDIRGVNYKKRKKLLELETLKRFIENGGAHSYAGALAYNALLEEYAGDEDYIRMREEMIRKEKGEKGVIGYRKAHYEGVLGHLGRKIESRLEKLRGMAEWLDRGGIVDKEDIDVAMEPILENLKKALEIKKKAREKGIKLNCGKYDTAIYQLNKIVSRISEMTEYDIHIENGE